MATRVFSVPLLVTIETDEDLPPVELDDVRAYLEAAMLVDVDTEDCGNPIGFSAAALVLKRLTELTPEEIARLRRRPASRT